MGWASSSWLSAAARSRYLAPAAYVIKVTPRRTYLNEFMASLTPALATALDEAARAFLGDQGIRDEPVTWHPSISLMDGLDLPGPDPTAVNIELMRELVTAGQNNISTVVEQLGTSVEVLRHLLQLHPPSPPPLARHQFRARGQRSPQPKQPYPEPSWPASTARNNEA